MLNNTKKILTQEKVATKSGSISKVKEAKHYVEPRAKENVRKIWKTTLTHTRRKRIQGVREEL